MGEPKEIKQERAGSKGGCDGYDNGCNCGDCGERRAEAANDRACAMNVWDADGHGFYDSFPEAEYMGRKKGAQ